MGISLTKRTQPGGPQYFRYKRINRNLRYLTVGGVRTLRYATNLHVVKYEDDNGNSHPAEFQETYTCIPGGYGPEPAIPPIVETAPNLTITDAILNRPENFWRNRCICAPAQHTNHTANCNPAEFYRNLDQHASLELRETENMGVGVFATRRIPAGTVLGLYSGQLMPKVRLNNAQISYSYQINITGPPRRHVTINSLERGNWTRFVNHHCDPNVNWGVRQNCGVNAVVVMTSRRVINVGDQLYVNYGEEYWRTQNRNKKTGELLKVQRIIRGGCKCGSYKCKNKSRAKS